ncbi:glycosyltransferase family 2 protein [Pseudomarimonas arenosa]|uniref:glycosyltransferase family 2 protein n=1 Tax=Pseudomarimonas arenosa TaxID=2774145 RepID=UPI0017876239|nr:glycosyltransferase [Pseudomarimonas arenosa]
MLLGWRAGRLRGILDLLLAAPGTPHFGFGYAKWVAQHGVASLEARRLLRERSRAFTQQPLISVLMPVYKPDLDLLREAVDSVFEQTYQHWQLCIADDASDDPSCRDYLKTLMSRDSRIKVVFRDKNGHISAASNSALDLCAGEFTALLDQDDLLPAHALHCVVDCINRNPGARLIYSDEDKIDVKGVHYDPYFKPDWDSYLILGQNLFSHLGVFETKLMREVGGFRQGYEGSQDYDLLLRCLAKAGSGSVFHIPHVLYHWRAVPGSTAQAMGQKSYAADAALRALADYLTNTKRPGRIEPGAFPGMYRFRPTPPSDTITVSVLFDAPPSDLAAWQRALSGLDANLAVECLFPDPDRAVNSVAPRPESATRAARLNQLAKIAKGDVLLFASAGVEPAGPASVSELVALASISSVGVAGARIIEASRRVLHAGYVLGMFGGLDSPHRGFPVATPGYFGQLELLRRASAVSAAAMAVRRNVFQQLGGFSDLAIGILELDFSRRVESAGMDTVITPHADFVATQPTLVALTDSSISVPGTDWPEDRHYNPNLTLMHGAYLIDRAPRVALPWA